MGHGGLEAGEGGDVGVARVDEVGRVQVAAERERAGILEHLERVRRHVGDVLQQMDVKLDPERGATGVASATWVAKNGAGWVATCSVARGFGSINSCLIALTVASMSEPSRAKPNTANAKRIFESTSARTLPRTTGVSNRPGQSTTVVTPVSMRPAVDRRTPA